jgi:hypothetical protein
MHESVLRKISLTLSLVYRKIAAPALAPSDVESVGRLQGLPDVF